MVNALSTTWLRTHALASSRRTPGLRLEGERPREPPVHALASQRTSDLRLEGERPREPQVHAVNLKSQIANLKSPIANPSPASRVLSGGTPPDGDRCE